MGQAMMIQGTASGVGKSTLLIGLCRLFRRRGLSVAPFKAQNMSSNAHHCPDGRQMARSQAIAAFAAGLPPHPDMNPILLKPSSGAGVEVIVQGVSQGIWGHAQYNTEKPRLAELVMQSYHRLLEQHDLLLVEGAGSPVELNLKQNDLVNMGFAKRAQCPVLLVGDISRGGVFASIYGTLALLDEVEHALVKGIIVNQFQGDVAYFAEGKDILETLTKKPVLGILPRMDLQLEDEDSLLGQETKTKESIQKTLPLHMDYEDHMQEQCNRLADMLETHLDTDALLQLDAGQTIEP